MSLHPNTTPVDILACFGVERGTKFPHWMLMLNSQGASTGTWCHTTGGPTQNRPYQVTIQANKRVDSHGIKSVEKLGTINPKDIKKVTGAANRIPAQQCQTYVVALVADLEKRRLLPVGNAERLHRRVQMSDRAREYARAHPVPGPSFVSQAAGPSNTHTQPGTNRRPSPPRQSPPRQIQASPPRQRPQAKKDSGGCCLVM